MLKNSHYRIPYQGSKQSIAHHLLAEMLRLKPKAKYFIDLFGGGGAMSACALENGLSVHYNEIKPNLAGLFELATTKGIPKEWRRWVSKEEFDRYKKENSVFGEYIRCVWSFGNSGKSYLFSKDKEGWKKAGHLILTELDLEGLEAYKEKLGYPKCLEELPSLFKPLDLSERLSIWVNLILKLEAMQVSGLYLKCPDLKHFDLLTMRAMKQREIIDLINAYCPDVPKKLYKRNRSGKPSCLKELDRLEQLEQLEQLERLERLEQLQQLERLERLQQLERLERLTPKLSFSSLDYREVKIETPIAETIIYCDPPYKGTAGYNNTFDSDVFFEWCASHSYSVFVSEYAEIENLHKVFEIQKRALMDSKATHCVTEKLYANIRTTLF